jgi:hypothetical protein
MGGTAGTNDIEKSWDLIKDGLPRHLSCRTEVGRAEIDEHVRDRQWTFIVSTEDAWPQFCQAAAEYRRQHQDVQSGGPLVDSVDVQPVEPAEPAQTEGSAAASSSGPPAAPPIADSAGNAAPLQPAARGWMCKLLKKELGCRDLPPQWFNDPRTGAIKGKTQEAATCGLHAVQHLLSVKDKAALVRRSSFEALCRNDVDEFGNYEYEGIHRNLASHGCSAEPLTPDLVETLTYRNEDGAWTALFSTGSSECSMVLGYLIHTPGHWVAVVPGGSGGPDHVGMLCDSLYDCVFHLTGEELAELMEAMALRQVTRPDAVHGEWSAYRVFVV